MYVRSKNKRIETCPISGTIQRGDSAIEVKSNSKSILRRRNWCKVAIVKRMQRFSHF